MKISYYDIMYLLTSVLGTYTIYKFMNIFLDVKKAKITKELIMYGIYYILSSLLYLLVDIPILMLVFNVLSFMVIALSYRVSLKRAVLATCFIYLILMVIETIVVITSGYLWDSITDINDYSSILGLITIKLVSYIVVLLIGNYKNIRNGVDLHSGYWLALTFVPVGSLYLSLIILQSERLTVQQVSISLLIVLMINFITFYLYDFMSHFFSMKLKESANELINKSYNKQFEIMKQSIIKTKAFQHDYRKHMEMINVLVNKKEYDKIESYLESMDLASKSFDTLNSTGNIVMDSVINFEMGRRVAQNIEVTLDTNDVPEYLNIKDYDLAIILSNILSNAVAATSKLDEKRIINIGIIYDKNTLFILVKNTFDGIINYENGNIQTIKEDQENHGFGLKNVRSAVEKYDGNIKISNYENVFKVEIILYNKC